jgi:hypothetical protein
MEQQRSSAWQLSAQSTWEARLSVLLQSLRRFFALIHTSPFSCRVQWKLHTVQWKPAQRALES